MTEPYAPAGASLTLTFTLTCTSSVSGLSATASAKSVENAAAPSKSGGGGALDPLTVLFLTGIAGLLRSRHKKLLSDTKTAEDLAEQILAAKITGDFAQIALREP